MRVRWSQVLYNVQAGGEFSVAEVSRLSRFGTGRAALSVPTTSQLPASSTSLLAQRLSYARLQVPDLHWSIVICLFTWGQACFCDALATSDFCEDDVGLVTARHCCCVKRRFGPVEFLFRQRQWLFIDSFKVFYLWSIYWWFIPSGILQYQTYPQPACCQLHQHCWFNIGESTMTMKKMSLALTRLLMAACWLQPWLWLWQRLLLLKNIFNISTLQHFRHLQYLQYFNISTLQHFQHCNIATLQCTGKWRQSHSKPFLSRAVFLAVPNIVLIVPWSCAH